MPTYNWKADAADHLASETEMDETDKDPMQSSGYVESIEQSEYLSGSELADRH